MQPSNAELVRLYRLMLMTRRAEETVDELFREGKLRGMGHWSTGQEAAGVGVGAALRSDDYLFPTHRGWPEFIGKGMTVAEIVAEFSGRGTGCANGKGGLHISSKPHGVVGLVGSLGSDFPVAVGAGLGAKLRGTDQVSCVYFGEGTVAQADFHPAMEIAVMWQLPVIFACVNNQYVELHHYREIIPWENVLDLAHGYHMNAIMVEDGNDIAAVYSAMCDAVARARAGQGPTMLEFKSYRISPHFTGDPGTYMPADEVAAWKQRDPVATCRARMLRERIVDETELAELEQGVEQEVHQSMQFVLDSPFPALESMYTGVFVQEEVIA